MINDIVQLLGLANPQLSKFWTLTGRTTATTLPTVNADSFTLASGSSDEWCAPCTGILTENQHHSLLQLPDGSTPSTGIVLQMSPQVYLAINHLYATIIEGKSPGAVADRPVPKYFLFSSVTKLSWTDGSTSKTGPDAGLFQPGSQLHLQGNMSIHDQEGIAIDPVAVASVFDKFMQDHWSIEFKNIGDPAPAGSPPQPFSQPAARQTFNLSQTGSNQKRLYFTDIYNKPFAPATFPFNNTTVVTSSVRTVDNAANPVAKNAGVNALVQLAASVNGLFSNAFTFPALAAGVSLSRDFFRIKVVNWRDHLLGDIPNSEPTKTNNVLPEVRENELLTFCTTGNECLGRINGILSGAADEKLVVSTDVQGDFALPPTPDGSNNHLWPAFSQGTTTNVAAIPASVENNITKSAHFITDPATNHTDVYLQFTGAALQNGWAVRVFNRVFHSDGTETRGDGAGTIVQNNTAAFRLKDPFRINRPFTSVSLPASPVLLVDMIIINAADPIKSRRYGNLVTTVQNQASLTPQEQTNLLPATNNLTAIANIGISPSGFLGVRTSASPISSISNINTYLLASGTDVQPRQAPTLPTQSRLEGIAASKSGANWQALQSGLRIMKESRENFLSIGNPASPGGTDTHTTGVFTQNGVLAYDLARAGLRRAQNFSERMKRLVNNANYVLPTSAAATNKTFVGAVLQTIAKKTESPRLEEFQQSMTNLPANANALKNDIQALLTSDTKPAWLPDSIKTQFKTAMTGSSAGANYQLAFDELWREYSSSINGRRDTFYSLKTAIGNARHFIYIETSFFGPTKYPGAPGNPAPVDDLVEVLLQTLISRPGLKLILALAQEVPFNRGYDNIARFHKKVRNDALLRLLGTQNSTTHKYQRHNQVVAFHPLAFPGRPVKISTQCIIIDDVWAMVGSSGFSQRGLFFDGSTDLVFTDKQLKNGKSAALTNFRRQLMLQYIRTDNALPGLPASNQVFLQNGRSAFEMLRTLLDGGGGAMIKEFVPETLSGITAQELAALENLADPNGNTFYQSQAQVNSWLSQLNTVPE